MMYTDRFLKSVLEAWGLEFKQTRPDLAVAGSPERCEFRVVAETSTGGLFLMESLPEAGVPHKRRIMHALEHLSRRGLAHVQPYLPKPDGEIVTHHEGSFWQIVPYTKGEDLDRRAYVFEGWRGQVLADFLIGLRRRAGDVPGFDPAHPFSILDFIRDFQGKLEQHDPVILRRIEPPLNAVMTDFPALHDRLPISFCHGDFHPLNVIWSKDQILSVIDWEFLGYKPELYDAANLVGCAGMENPSCLTGDLVGRLIERLRESGRFQMDGWTGFFEFVLALRFAWLSEWLRKPDPEMVELECVYLDLLLENRARLSTAWGLS